MAAQFTPRNISSDMTVMVGRDLPIERCTRRAGTIPARAHRLVMWHHARHRVTATTTGITATRVAQ